MDNISDLLLNMNACFKVPENGIVNLLQPISCLAVNDE